MRSFVNVVVCSTLVSIGVPAGAESDTDGGPEAGWQAGLNIGYTCGGNTMSGNLAFGVQGTYQFQDSPLRVEMGYTRLEDSGTTLDSSGITKSDELDINALTVTGLWRTPLGETVSGYAGGGVGCYLSDFRESLDGGFEWTRSGRTFGYHLDCGIDFAAGRNVEVFADVRYAIISYPGKNTVNTTDVPGRIGTVRSDDTTKSWDQFMLRIGASYKF